MKKTVDPVAERPARAVDKIRASASELFYREGIRAVGVDEVVDRAGVTKPSLYRSFASKDDLAAAYMRDYELDFWEKFEKPGGKSYSDAREHVLAYIRWLSARALSKGYRGCGLSNATVEYPSRDNPARQVAEAHKKVFRKRLRELAAAMGARHPAVLGDALQLLNRRHLHHGPAVGRGAGAVGVRGGEAVDRCERGEGAEWMTKARPVAKAFESVSLVVDLAQEKR